MDCARVSSYESTDEAYPGEYIQLKNLKGKSEGACRQACVSSRTCEAWKYTPDQRCYVSDVVYGRLKADIPGVRTGIIKCASSPNLFMIGIWIVVLGLILFALFFALRRKSQGLNIFPRFHLEGRK